VSLLLALLPAAVVAVLRQIPALMIQASQKGSHCCVTSSALHNS
jgi:hypothetical protein